MKVLIILFQKIIQTSPRLLKHNKTFSTNLAVSLYANTFDALWSSFACVSQGVGAGSTINNRFVEGSKECHSDCSTV